MNVIIDPRGLVQHSFRPPWLTNRLIYDAWQTRALHVKAYLHIEEQMPSSRNTWLYDNSRQVWLRGNVCLNVCDCESSVIFQALFTQKQMHSPLVAPCRGIRSITAASPMRRAARGPYGRLSVPHCLSSISKLSAADSVPQRESRPDRSHTDKRRPQIHSNGSQKPTSKRYKSKSSGI